MDVTGFQQWLLSVKGLKRATCQSRISNCLKVERYEGDLDVMYEKDRMEELLQRLTYTTDDERKDNPCKHLIPLSGNVRRGSATLKSAAVLYRDFRDIQRLDVLFVVGSDDKAADYRRQMLWGDKFMKRYANQLESLHSDPLFRLIVDRVDEKLERSGETDCKFAAVDVFSQIEPERRFQEMASIVSDTSAAGHKEATAYVSVYCGMKILDLARL